MISQTAKFFASTLAWAATALVLILCVVLLRLFLMPIDLEFARDKVLAATDQALPGWTLDYRSASIGWHWRRIRPWVDIRDLVASSPDRRIKVDIPAAAFSLSWTSLISGPQLHSVDVSDTRLYLHMPKDDMQARIQPSLATTPDPIDASKISGQLGAVQAGDAIPIVVQALNITDTVQQTLPGLVSVLMRNTRVLVTGTPLAPEIDITVTSTALERDSTHSHFTAALDLPLSGDLIGITVTADADTTARTLGFDLGLSNLQPKALADRVALPPAANWVDIPVSATLSLALSETDGLNAARAVIELAEGQLYDAAVYPEPAVIHGGEIVADFDPARHALTLTSVAVDLPGSEVRGFGELVFTGRGSGPETAVDLFVDTAAVRTVLNYWPITRYPDGRPRGARSWIDRHMIAADTTNIHFQLRMDENGIGAFYENSPYKLNFTYDNLDTYAVTSMPPIIGARGSAVLTRSRLESDIISAVINDVAISQAHILLSDIEKKGQNKGFFDARLTGGAQPLFEVLDHRPIRLGERLKITPDRVGGEVDVRARVFIALKPKITEEDLYYHAEGRVTDGVFRDLLGGEGVSNAALTFRIDQDRAEMEGDLTLNAIPIRAEWTEDLRLNRTDPEALSAHTKVWAALPAQDMENIGVASSRYLHGPVTAVGTFQGRGLKPTTANFAVDATRATLELPELAWSRGPGAPLKITGDVVFADGEITVSPVAFRGEAVDADMRLRLRPTAGSSGLKMTAEVRQLGDHSMSARVTQNPGGDFDVWADASVFDARPLLKAVNTQDAKDILVERQQVARAEDVAAIRAPVEQTPPVHINLTADTMVLMNGETLSDVTLMSNFVAGEPVQVEMDGQIASADGMVPVGLTIGGDDLDYRVFVLRPLTMMADNGGALMRGLGYFSQLEGGDFRMTGQTRGWGKDLYIDAQVKSGSARLLSSTALSESVTSGKIESLDPYIEDGISLNEIEIPFRYDGGLLDFSDLKANGPSIGLTLEGQIETRLSQLNVNGVLVPAYSINSLIGKIPLLGDILAGGDGEGLFAFAYRVQGDFENPDVKVSRLSGLAPGFLRGLFEGSKGKIETIDPKTTKSNSDQNTGDSNAAGS